MLSFHKLSPVLASKEVIMLFIAWKMLRFIYCGHVNGVSNLPIALTARVPAV